MNHSFLKKAAPFFLAAAMVLGMSTAAFATTKEKITDVSISINYELSNNMAKSDVDVDCSSEGVDSISVSSITNTDYGKRPKVVVKLKADTSDYTFTGISKSNVTCNDSDVNVTKISVSSSALTVTLSLPKIGSSNTTGLDVPDVSWSDDANGTVEWEQADDADKYEVKLLRGSSTKTTITTTNTSYNFKSEIRSNGKGDYTVKVRAVAGTYKGEWTESEDWEIDEDTLTDLGGKTTGSSSSDSGAGPGTGTSGSGAWLKGSNGQWWYCNADRSYTTNNWQQIDGYWYYFDANGYMKTGWVQSPTSKKWYYLNTTSGSALGRMVTSSYVENGKYYVDANGVWDGVTH